jgi:hypothetical protein
MKEDIIKMAREADLWLTSVERIEAVERFAALVRADEREACAKVAFNAKTYIEAAAAIRARGEPEQEPVKRTVMYRPADLEALGLTHEDVVNLIKEQS